MNFVFENKFLKVIFFILLAIAIVFFGKADILKLSLVGTLFLLILVITNIEIVFILLVIVGFTFNFLTEAYGFPGKIVFLYDLIIYLFFLYGLVGGKRKIYRIEFLFIFYVIFLVISTILGRESLPLKLKGVIVYIRYPILFISLMRLNIKSDTYKRVLKFIIFMSILQVPTSIVQFLKGNRPDWCGGFLARYGTGIGAVLMASMFLFILGWMIVDRIRLKYLLYSIFFMIPLILGSARAGFIFFFLAMIFMFIVYMLHVKYVSAYSLFFTVVGILLIFLIFYTMLIYIVPIFEPKTAKTLEVISSIENIKKDMLGTYSEGKLRRLSNLLFAYEYLKKDILTLSFGNGPGTVVVSKSFGNSEFMQEYERFFESSLSFPSYFLEIGIGGLFFVALIYFYVIFFSLTRAIHIEDKFLRITAFALSGISFLYLLASVYTAVWSQEALQLLFIVSFAALIEPAYGSAKKEKIFAILFLKTINPGEKASITKLLTYLINNEIKTIFVVSNEDNENLLWIKENKRKLGNSRIKWIKSSGDRPLEQIFYINSLLERYKVNMIFFYMEDDDITEGIMKDAFKHTKSFIYEFLDKKFIMKILKNDIIKFLYLIKDKKILEQENYLEIIKKECYTYNIQMETMEKKFVEKEGKYV